jgi:hypothetical protein
MGNEKLGRFNPPATLFAESASRCVQSILEHAMSALILWRSDSRLVTSCLQKAGSDIYRDGRGVHIPSRPVLTPSNREGGITH